ncbi:MAG: hypothetical protein ACE5IR_23905, partial [bacterium]
QVRKSAEPKGNWPSFRGNYASGVADGQNLPDEWDGESGHNIKWKTRIPGLAHSSPIIWGKKVFVTTAISTAGDHSFKHGLYGEGTASADRSKQRWMVYCLYSLNNNGVFDCYDLQTGEEKYRQRIRHSGGGFSASPVAADGKIYLSGEDGDISVVKAGPEYELIAANEIGELLMATPALSDGRMYVRAKEHLFAIGY